MPLNVCNIQYNKECILVKFIVIYTAKLHSLVYYIYMVIYRNVLEHITFNVTCFSLNRFYKRIDISSKPNHFTFPEQFRTFKNTIALFRIFDSSRTLH